MSERTFWVYFGNQVPEITQGRVRSSMHETTASSFYAALGYAATSDGNHATRLDIWKLQQMLENDSEDSSHIIIAYDQDEGPRPPDRVGR